MLDDSNDIEDDLSKVAFTWSLVSFDESGMQIQIEFTSPVYVSTGFARDKLRATVRKPAYFQSRDTFLSIPIDAADKIKIPKQMANTAFTKAFASFNVGAGDLTNGALLGNFLFNLLLSGAMNLLWGLLHAMQIVAHFPLINIMMPSNASMLFQVIVKIATFDMLPTEEFIQAGEDRVGLQKDSISISDSFEDFGFDSTDPIRNLQVMFLFLVLLLIYPVFSLGLRGLCFCSNRCKRCLNWLDSMMFWNTYIRFALEAYLELQICVLLRFKNFSFEGADQIFYSAFTILIMASTWSFMIFAAVFTMQKFVKLEQPGFVKKFGDLYLGLNTKSRIALLSPVLFMVRRIAYAGICVFWFDRSYFQIQFLIFKQSMFMMFSGQFRP